MSYSQLQELGVPSIQGQAAKSPVRPRSSWSHGLQGGIPSGNDMVRKGNLKCHSPSGHGGGGGLRLSAWPQHLLLPEHGTATDCTVETVGCLQQPLSDHAMSCPLPMRRWGSQVYLHLLLGMHLLPEGLHASCKLQEARDTILEELPVVGLHRPLQPRFLSPPLQHKAQPRSPHLQGEEEVRPSSPCLGSPRGCAHPALH